MDLLKKIYVKINQESPFENEAKYVLVLLRVLYLAEMVYGLAFALLTFPVRSMVWAPELLFYAGMIACFCLTYRVKKRTNLIIYGVFQTVWGVFFVYLFGWDCGIQHFMFSLLVLSFFSVYDALKFKLLLTVSLFALRFGMFCYCRVFDPVIELPGVRIMELQILNSLILFVRMAVICGFFSSNIETAEQKLVLYNERLEQLASLDPLTGVWNRRSMLNYMERYRKAHPTEAFTVAMGDIDHFKQVNDCYGHDCGDAVLVWLTGMFQEYLGEQARICRWGGEEFLFHFSEMNGDEAYRMLVDLKNHLNGACFRWEENEIPITLTIGVEENDFQSELSELIRRVDEKLYQGKNAGRNRIVY